MTKAGMELVRSLTREITKILETRNESFLEVFTPDRDTILSSLFTETQFKITGENHV